MTPPSREVSLSDRTSLLEGRVFLSGVQALVRLLLDQHRADSRGGMRTATFVSGYQGSPLAGFDREVARLGALAEAHEIVFTPGVNEELGATAVWGTQLAGGLPGPRYDGVLGVWYGKAPGVDRSADAIRHGNYVGTDPRGGVLALVGDDPACKSSTIPGASEPLLAALGVPVLVPGTVQEALDLGRHAIACSRASGLWAALKVVTAVADATATVEVGLDRVTPVVPVVELDGAPYVHRPSAHLLAPNSLELERTLNGVRLELARAYSVVNRLNRVTHDRADACLGIVASGTAYHDVLQVVSDFGLARLPVRIFQVTMAYPLDSGAVRAFADGLDEVLVVEEKGPFLERLVKEALYGMAGAPRVVGERDEHGNPLVPSVGALGPTAIARALGSRLLVHHQLPEVRDRLNRLKDILDRPSGVVGASRTPFFCSGCPHNSSTIADDDVLVGAGIGCHTMVMLNPKGHGQITGITQMGGEGAQWIGAGPFVEKRHLLQNLGDGTFHHSGSLAIRAAVAAGSNITYKLLYNDTVAMTGGQHVEGQMSVESIARSLAAEGVKRIVITTDDPARYADVALPSIAEVRGRARLLAAQRELSEVEGVTVLIHDQGCAAELRRARRRGRASEPREEVVINERVCEGCGDCGEKSGCLSVEPVDTEFGRKTRIHQASCNKDYSCLQGDCPSFLTIIHPDGTKRHGTPPLPAQEMPEPELRVPAGDVRIRLVGIGGTGVVTVSQVLGMAALVDGVHASGLDQTGLSQKAGPVVSDLRLTTEEQVGGVSPSVGGVDTIVGFDILGAADPRNLAFSDPSVTVGVISTSVVPTGEMVVDPSAQPLDLQAAIEAISSATRPGENVLFDAQEVSHVLFGDHMPANFVLVGAAWQHGAIPLTRAALHEALRLNGATVETNIAAFEWGRACVAAPDLVSDLRCGEPVSVAVPQIVRSLVPEPSELQRLLAIRAADLDGWGGPRVAARYVAAVARVLASEQEVLPGRTEITEEFACGLHKLMAYKDEYEVARLHVEELRRLPRGARARIHLHPPVLRALGMQRKLVLGRWFVPVLATLRHGRRLRGTPLDVFGYAEVRKVERRLIGEYQSLVDRALARLSWSTRETVVQVAQLPDLVRGYESIKVAAVERFRDRAEQLMEELERSQRLPGVEEA